MNSEKLDTSSQEENIMKYHSTTILETLFDTFLGIRILKSVDEHPSFIHTVYIYISISCLTYDDPMRNNMMIYDGFLEWGIPKTMRFNTKLAQNPFG